MDASDLILPMPQRKWAYFLDFDGTLVDIADRPNGIRVERELVSLLADLDRVTGAAIVLVSGRTISDLDSHLQPLKLRAAGLHGLECRMCRDGPIERQGPRLTALDAARPSLACFAASHDGVEIEDKGIALAIHFRRAPQLQAEARLAAEKACRDLGPTFTCLAGKKVYEIKPRDVHKGQAIERFMKLDTFAGRRLVFVGDDITDEDGFRVCNARGGISVRVGARDETTDASFKLESVAELENWLGLLVDPADGPRP